jgi:signal transduction histidine kinase
MTAVIISLPQEPWQTVVPGALLFPTLLWLAARCRPLFAASGAFLVSLTVVWTAILGIGHFGDVTLPIDDRILQAQAVILVVALGASVLAALFAERRENEARLAHSNMMLERERDNKLMNVEAITVAIAHEVRQPLAAIVANGSAALRFLDKEPPDRDEVRAALNRIVNDGHRTSEVFDGIRSLFRKVDQGRDPVDINNLILGVLQSLQGEFKDRVIELRSELAADLPLIDGHESQLQEVIFNLVRNATEAMDNVTGRNRVLHVTTALRDRETITVAVEDSGPGIDPKRLDEIFNAFFTTKSQGTGLGLAICRMIIEHHGGQLIASSDGENGALFQFALPIESANIVTVTAR